MSDLLREMDHGPSALPAGSSLTLFNNTSTDEVIARVKKRNRCSDFGTHHPCQWPCKWLLVDIAAHQTHAPHKTCVQHERKIMRNVPNCLKPAAALTSDRRLQYVFALL